MKVELLTETKNSNRIRTIRIKLKFFLIVWLFIYSKSFAQSYTIEFGDTINRIDKNGNKQGFWFEETYGEIASGKYLNNLKVSAWTFYDLKGNGKRLEFYKNGKKTGRYKNGSDIIITESGAFFVSRKIRRNFSNVVKNATNDSNLYLKFIVIDESIFLTKK